MHAPGHKRFFNFYGIAKAEISQRILFQYEITIVNIVLQLMFRKTPYDQSTLPINNTLQTTDATSDKYL